MKNYIILDLEWNQSPYGKDQTVEDLPFEILEIGAVKLDETFQLIGEFHQIIRPRVYSKMHNIISQLTHLDMENLVENGVEFSQAAQEFFAWSGEEAVYCTWGSMDLTEFERNLDYYNMENLFGKPLFYYDVQKLYGIFFHNKEKVALELAVEELGIAIERPFHRALDDAWYTGQVMKQLDWETAKEYYSVDYYQLPMEKEEELHLVFPEYSKYVSCGYPNKEDAMKGKMVTEMRCYKCGRTLRKKIRWFSANQKMYYGLAICPEHGYVKGHIRLKKAQGDTVFAVKTLKITDESGAEKVALRRDMVRKKRAERNKTKKGRKK